MNNSVVNQYVVNNKEEEELQKRKKRNRLKLILFIILILLLCAGRYIIYKIKTEKENVVVEVPLIYNTVNNKETFYDEETNSYYSYYLLYNYKENELSPIDLYYTITVYNKEGSHGMFKIEDMDTHEISEYNSETKISGVLTHDAKREKRFKIHVFSTEDDSKRIDYEIKSEIKRQ